MTGAFADRVASVAARRRVEVADLWVRFFETDPVGARAVDARARLAALIERGEADGRWQASAKLDRTALPHLPAFVTLPAAERPAPTAPSSVAWRPELGWAGALPRLSDVQLRMLVAVNAWLRDGGSNRPIVPAAERSLELFDDEKAIDARTGGDTLWAPERLTLPLLRCEPTLMPLAFEPAGQGRELLIVENQATFASALRVLREDGSRRWGGVGWGEGRAITRRIAYVAKLPLDVTSVGYFGDLDLAGLQIAAAATATASELGLPPVRPAVELYDILVCARPTPDRPVTREIAQRQAMWLPAHLRASTAELLISGQRLAQERAGYQVLKAEPSWR
jgi:hypothetical protein